MFRGAYFLCKGCDLEQIKFGSEGKGREGIAEFHFVGEGILDLDRDYRDGSALVNPVQLESAINDLRDYLFKAKRKKRRDEKNHQRYLPQSGYRDNTYPTRIR
jgi:hypothetical protein